MASSLIDAQRKVLILDETSKSLVFNAVNEDDILKENVTRLSDPPLTTLTGTDIEYIENRRATYKDTPALYILSAQPYLADCVVADLQRRRYRSLHLVWTSKPTLEMKNKILAAPHARELVADFSNINVDYLPREGCLALFRDPWVALEQGLSSWSAGEHGSWRLETE
ncbi:vacuolar sorting protein VPS33/slp1 [Ascosphaera acerosa]|nr:vacuolar sorting protein VPS33/slp1 [Ascosphaera acerosa]